MKGERSPLDVAGGEFIQAFIGLILMLFLTARGAWRVFSYFRAREAQRDLDAGAPKPKASPVLPEPIDAATQQAAQDELARRGLLTRSGRS